MPESGRTVSLWQDEFENPGAAPPPTGELRCDVCVIGAGIAGLTTAYRLARSGRKVVLVDDGPIGGGATLRTTGHLCTALDDRYYRLAQRHGAEGARLAAESHGAAVDEIERIAGEHAIACDFRRVDGYLVAGRPDADGVAELRHELEAATAAGLPVAMSRVPSERHDFGPALAFANQGQFHAGRYLAGLARAAMEAGVSLHTQTHAVEIEGGKDAHVTTAARARIGCGAVVVATNTPINDRVVMHTKQAAYRTYVVAFRVPRDSVPAYLLWDTLDPYHYVRTQDAGDGEHAWLIVGGEDHKTGQDRADHAFRALGLWTQERYAVPEQPIYRWSGQVLEPHDGLAFIGRNPLDHDNVYLVTGDSGNGLTHGTIAGLLLEALISGVEHPWATLYDPSRKSLRASGTFLKETANFVAQYKDLVLPGEIKDPVDLKSGNGALIRRGAAIHALFRDQRGSLHEHSAICPHLGCVVQWNPTEATWDCPCHGSRFRAADGEVINGPANKGLKPIEFGGRRAASG